MAARQRIPETPATVVVGLGRTGLACVRHLLGRGAALTVVDSRRDPPGLPDLRRDFPEVPVVLGPFDPGLLCAADRLVVSPGVPVSEPAVSAARTAGVEVTGDIDLFAAEVSAPVVAITGTNGKSTVTTLVGHMAADQGVPAGVGGNLGIPVLELLAAGPRDLYVLELSSFQLETCNALCPAAAVVLNLEADHLDRYPDLAAYAGAKARVYAGAAVQVLNRDDPRVMAMAVEGAPVVTFGGGTPEAGQFGLEEDGTGETWLRRGPDRLLAGSQMRLAGRHNALNGLAALALGEAVGLDLDAMLGTLARFPGLPHRCQWLAEAAGVAWYNDSKGTNVGATLAAVAGLRPRGQLVLIAGGDGKGQDFRPLAPALAGRARQVVVLGRDGARIAEVLEGVVPVLRVRDMEAAVHAAARAAQPGDAVLLSPACASLDMYPGYEARGADFAAAVARTVGP